MPERRRPERELPQQLWQCPWHGQGFVSMNNDQERREGQPIFPLVLLRTLWINYGCGCQLMLDEDLTAARQRAMGIR